MVSSSKLLKMGNRLRSLTTGSRMATHGKSKDLTLLTRYALAGTSRNGGTTEPNVAFGKGASKSSPRLTIPQCLATTPTTQTTCVFGAQDPTTNSTSSSLIRGTTSVPLVSVKVLSTSPVCSTLMTQVKAARSFA